MPASSPAPRCSPQEAHGSVNGDCKAGRSNPVPRVCERSGFGAASGSSSRRSRRTARVPAGKRCNTYVRAVLARVLPSKSGASKSVIILLIQHHSSVICPILTLLQRTAEQKNTPIILHVHAWWIVLLQHPHHSHGPSASRLVPGKQVVTTMYCK